MSLKYFKYALFALVLLSAACSRRGEYDVYLLIGQSNMAGRGFLEPDDTTAVLDGVYLLDGEGLPVPAVEPLNRYSTIRKGMPVQGVSLAHSFAQQMHAQTGKKVLLVMNARGGTSIRSWLKGAPQENYGRGSDDPQNWGKMMPSFYDEAVRRAKEGMKYGPLKAIVWHQGESDSDPDRIAGYMENLQTLVRDLRTDLGVGADVPFAAGGILPTHENAPAFNPMLEKIGEWIPNSCFVSSEGLAGNPDNLHFNRMSQLEFGRRYASAVGGRQCR